MRNQFKTLLAALLFSICGLCSCQGGSTPSSDDSVYKHHYQYFKGNHVFNVKETENYLVKDGETDYALLIPSTSSTYLNYARTEFVSFFKKATGITLEVVFDDPENPGKLSGNYISLGETSLFKKSGLSVDKKTLKSEGTRLLTKDKNIFILGNNDTGVLFGVYDFMEVYFDYEQYNIDCQKLTTGLENVKFKELDITDVPDINERNANYGFLTSSGDDNLNMIGERLRLINHSIMPVHLEKKASSPSKTIHNCDYILPASVYKSEHPNWYSVNCSGDDNQWCYTARGNENELNQMVAAVADKIEYSLSIYPEKDFPEYNVVTITMQDNFNTCTCEACTASRTKYGCDSGAVVAFVNKVAKLVQAWEDDNPAYAREDLRIVFFAYNAFEPAPVKKDDSGKYVAIAPEVVLEPNVGVYLAEINKINYQRSIFADVNLAGKQIFDGWASLTDFIFFWTYETNFHYYTYLYDSFSFFNQEGFNYISSKNIGRIYPQGQWDGSGNTSNNFDGLKTFLYSKLAWDSSIDEEQLVKRYFKNMYGEAADTMLLLFETERAHQAWMLSFNPNLDVPRSNYNKVAYAEYYPLGTLEQFISIADEALGKIAKYENSNPELYLTLYKRIEAEAFNNIFNLLDIHRESLSSPLKEKYIKRLSNDIPLLGLENKLVREAGETVSSIIKGF